MVDFNAAEGATYTRRGQFFTPGRHLCRVLKATTGISKKNNANCEMVVVELEVVKSLPITLGYLTPEEIAAGKTPQSKSEPLEAGELRTWLMKNDGATKSMFLGMVKNVADSIKGSVRAQTVAKLPGSTDVVLPPAEAATLAQLPNGQSVGFKLEVPGSVADEMRNIYGDVQLGLSQPIWVECNRTETTRKQIIDGVQFAPLTASDVENYGAELGLF